MSRRGLAALIGAVAGLVIATSPAFAHFCYREFSTEGAANAAKSQAWFTKADYLAAIPSFELPPACETALTAFVSAGPSTRLYMGPGLLAGGTLKNGKDNTPDKVGYSLLIPGCEGIFE